MLSKALYGLKQAPRPWYEKIHAYLVAHGFQKSSTENTLPNKTQIANFKVDLNVSFEMSDLGYLHHYLGIHFKQCDGGIALSQIKYIETLLCTLNLEDCKPMATPMDTGLTLRSLHDARDYFDVTLYQIAVDCCLIYVCITRLDMQFAVSQVSKFMLSLGSLHWKAAKQIFCYLSDTMHLGLLYPKGDHSD
ncbi:hypothetical protein L7F22_029937 [Adiantum nelumboides]|nr:hypothetical protein [Adiantum nelumboides]